MKFGCFISPIHPPRENPTLALRQDVELVQHLDRLGYDEAWVGEHHSSGWEIIPSPEVFLAHAAALTQRIKLGTGVVSLPYHNPFMVAERMVLLDHLSNGRAMLGVGPGALVNDASQIGLDPLALRSRMEEALGVIQQLLRGERVTRKTEWFDLRDAQLQLLPHQREALEIAVTATATPSGPRLAGKYGTSLLSLTATATQTTEILSEQWSIAEAEAAKHGNTVSREGWRLVVPMYVAPSEEEARRDVEYGLASWIDYVTEVATLGLVVGDASTTEEYIELLTGSGFAVIGSPQQAVQQINRLIKASGGFGSVLVWANQWAPRDRMLRSYELIAKHVIPHFQPRPELLRADALARQQRLASREATLAARDKARSDYADQVAQDRAK
jgi:limonene 1,2-monooxygenase